MKASPVPFHIFGTSFCLCGTNFPTVINITFTPAVPIGRNQPLKPESPKWKSDIPLTKGQLKSKRDEFWETAPAFEGRKEIWDALRGAAQELENGEHALAQAIVDGANITCPNGKRVSHSGWSSLLSEYIYVSSFLF